MATSLSSEFDSWLSKKLIELNQDTDIDVFVQYIRSILETEADTEETVESLQEILVEITVMFTTFYYRPFVFFLKDQSPTSWPNGKRVGPIVL